VPHGYACVRVDSRGCGCSPGFIDHFSPRETKDFHDCIEWSGRAAVVERQGRPQRPSRTTASTSGRWRHCSRRISPPSASGKAPPTGIATMDPPRPASSARSGRNWYDMQVKTVQYGAGETRQSAAALPRRARLRSGNAERGGTGQQPQRFRQRHSPSSARRRLSQGPFAGSGRR